MKVFNLSQYELKNKTLVPKYFVECTLRIIKCYSFLIFLTIGIFLINYYVYGVSVLLIWFYKHYIKFYYLRCAYSNLLRHRSFRFGLSFETRSGYTHINDKHTFLGSVSYPFHSQMQNLAFFLIFNIRQYWVWEKFRFSALDGFVYFRSAEEVLTVFSRYVPLSESVCK